MRRLHGLAGVVVVAATVLVSVGSVAHGTVIPQVADLTPSRGPSAGGEVITIHGSGFSDATSVRFGPASEAGFTVASDTEILATVPAGVDTRLVHVRVTTPGGTSATGAMSTYYYVDPPVVTSIEPRTGPTSGGTVVTITGTGFNHANKVRFNGTWSHVDVLEPDFTVLSDTQIVVTSPPFEENSGEVQVIEGFHHSPHLTAATFGWVGSIPPYEGNPGSPRLAILGDSITGLASTSLRDALTPDHEVAIKSLGSYRIAQFQYYAEQFAASPEPPQRAVINLGTNDVIHSDLASQGVPTVPPITMSQSLADLASMVSVFPPSTSCVVVVTVNGDVASDGSLGATFNSGLADLAASAAGRVQVADWNGSLQDHASHQDEEGWAPWLFDGIHPNLRGVAELTRLIDEALDRCHPATPSVADVSPGVGPSHGGNQVVITGSGFTGATGVRFGPAREATIVSLSDTELVVQAPDISGPALCHVRIDNPLGTSPTHAGSLYYFRP